MGFDVCCIIDQYNMHYKTKAKQGVSHLDTKAGEGDVKKLSSFYCVKYECILSGKIDGLQ